MSHAPTATELRGESRPLSKEERDLLSPILSNPKNVNNARRQRREIRAARTYHPWNIISTCGELRGSRGVILPAHKLLANIETHPHHPSGIQLRPEDLDDLLVIEQPTLVMRGRIILHEDEDGTREIELEQDQTLINPTLVALQCLRRPNQRSEREGELLKLLIKQHDPELARELRDETEHSMPQLRACIIWEEGRSEYQGGSQITSSSPSFSEMTPGESGIIQIGGHDLISELAEHPGSQVTILLSHGEIQFTPVELPPAVQALL